MPTRSWRTRLLLVTATVVAGILAGGVFDRVIVGGPAWHRLGAEAWAQYSSHADLGAGLFAYPIEGVGAAVLLLAAAVSYHLERNYARIVLISLYLAAAFSIVGLILTIKAAPIMLGLGTTLPVVALQQAENAFFFWGLYLRGAVDLLAFLSAVWALSISAQADR